MAIDRRDIELQQATHIAMTQMMGVKPGENVLIVSDTELSPRIADALVRGAYAVGAEVAHILYPSRAVSGTEPPPIVAKAMAASDVFIAACVKSITHTLARKEACAAGARGATWPAVTEEIVLRLVPVDYTEVARRCHAIADRWDQADNVVITAPDGTNLTLKATGRKASRRSGICHNPGEFNQIPGVSSIAPLEGTPEGTIVVNASMTITENPTDNLLTEPMRWTVENGKIVKIEGGSQAMQFKQMLAELNDANSYQVCEIGIGFHPTAIITGAVMEDERAAGVVHFGLGTNITHGGTIKAKAHLDGCLQGATLLMDGIPVVKDGKLVI